MEMGLPVVGEGCCRMEMGLDGVPHGVVGWRVATCVKPGRDCRPVPPMTAMGTGSGIVSRETSLRRRRGAGVIAATKIDPLARAKTYRQSGRRCWPSCGNRCGYVGGVVQVTVFLKEL
jgi:hypothetical protein